MERNDKKRGAAHGAVDAAALLAAACLYARECGGAGEAFAGETALSVAALAATAALVHAAKALRLSLAVCGEGVGMADHLGAYCRSAPASILFPFKTGELYRMYCYGRLTGSAPRGVATILLDRFMDTAALVSAIALAGLALGWRIEPLAYALAAFLALVFAAYRAYPGIRDFWRGRLLGAEATGGRLAMLRALDGLDRAYGGIEAVARGRGALMYLASLAAWAAEIGSMCALGALSGRGAGGAMVFGYLGAAVGGPQTAESRRFVIVSVALLFCAWLAMVVREAFARRRDGKWK